MPPEIITSEKEITPQEIISPIVSSVVLNPKREEWYQRADVKWLKDDGTVVPPKDYLENLKYRIWVREIEKKGIDDDHEMKKSFFRRAKKDVLFFFNTFLWTHDTRKTPADLPFITYGYEDELIGFINGHIQDGKDCFTEKSRDMGVSWCALGVIFWHWMFHPGFLALLGSKKEDDVDRGGDIRSLFEKLRYFLKEMPSWLRPFGWNWKQHSMFMRLINPAYNNSITGESANRDFGRAGRYKVCLLDEFAAMEYGDEAWTATGDSTPCRVVVSTPKGTGNKFWQLRFKSQIDRFTAHWTVHPEKAKDAYLVKDGRKLGLAEAFELWKKGEKVSSPWYEAEIQRRMTQETQSKIDIAQELDIDYLASGDPYFEVVELNKQAEWTLTEDWLNFGDVNKKKLIIGNLVQIDGKLEFRPNKNGWLRLFEKPSLAGQYIGALDPSEGLTHGDYAAGSFRDKKTRNLVAAIYGHFDYDELSMYGFMISRYFNNCVICAEAGGYGAAVNKRLYDLGANVARAVDFSSGSAVEKDRLGFVTSSLTRPKMLGDLAAEIREGACELRDKDLKNECMNFINNNGKPQAAQGSTDDFLMSFAIAGQLLRIRPYSEALERGYKKSSRLETAVPANNMGYGFKK